MAELGDLVKHKLSSFEGTVTGRAVYLYGCVQVLVNPGEVKDGKPVDSTWFDEDSMDVVEEGAAQRPASADTRKGGPAVNPMPNVGRGVAL